MELIGSIVALTASVAGLIIIIIRPRFEKRAATIESEADDTRTKSESLKLAIQLAQQALTMNTRLNEVEKLLQDKSEKEKTYIEQISTLNSALTAAQLSIVQHRKEIDAIRVELANCINVQNKQKDAP